MRRCRGAMQLWIAVMMREADGCCCAGVVAWGPLVPRLYTSLMWAFHVPVGTATATPPFSAPSTLASTPSCTSDCFVAFTELRPGKHARWQASATTYTAF